MSRLITDAVNALKKDEFIIYPTDTIYGIGIDLTKKKNYDRLVGLKKRSKASNKEFLVMFSSISQLKKYVNLTLQEERIIAKNMKRKFSFVLQKKSEKPIYIGEGFEKKVAFRIATNPLTKEIIERFGKPISSTSVNISGYPSAYSVDKIPKKIGDKVKVIIDAGELKGLGSTIIDISEKRIIRQGENAPLW